MIPAEQLKETLRRIDGRGYKAYRDIRGIYDFGDFQFHVDHVQGDPYAAPSRVRVRVPQKIAGFPPTCRRNRSREVGLRDFLTRRFSRACSRFSGEKMGSGKSGEIISHRPGQEILEHSAVVVNRDFVEARFLIGLPAFGRRIAGRQAERMFFDIIPELVKAALLFSSLDHEKLKLHIETVEDANFLRESLSSRNLVAFVANDSLLPRVSGIDPRPLKEGKIVPFESPTSLEMEFELPNRGKVRGMAVPQGVTLIVGGGYHGKSTLLKAMELGIYNHIPGDGRELVVTEPTGVKIRAEDGRRIQKVDISPFISNLPFGQDTTRFSSEDASGSTSQAANIMEALEIGTRLLLMDEDTSATNFMIRDARMQELIAREQEPITPFIDKVRQLHRQHGVSTILVMGGSGDYFDVADLVIGMVDYHSRDLSQEAKEVARRHRTQRREEGGENFGQLTQRYPLRQSFDPSRGKRTEKVVARGSATISFGRNDIDLSAVEQLVDASQTRAIGNAILLAMKEMNRELSLRELCTEVLNQVEERGLDVLSPWPVGHHARFRAQELAAAVNRLRTLEVSRS